MKNLPKHPMLLSVSVTFSSSTSSQGAQLVRQSDEGRPQVHELRPR